MTREGARGEEYLEIIQREVDLCEMKFTFPCFFFFFPFFFL